MVPAKTAGLHQTQKTISMGATHGLENTFFNPLIFKEKIMENSRVSCSLRT
jgi:hypothetical protein